MESNALLPNTFFTFMGMKIGFKSLPDGTVVLRTWIVQWQSTDYFKNLTHNNGPLLKYHQETFSDEASARTFALKLQAAHEMLRNTTDHVTKVTVEEKL